MSALLPFLSLDQTCDKTQAWAVQELTGAGLRVVQTFDLNVARLAHPDCTCPNHGTEVCNCQMIVLLVYQKKGDPVTLVIHGQESKSWLSFAFSDKRKASQRIEATIRRTLRSEQPVTLSLAEADL
ncbi:MAG TPA: hypothetical protein VK851_12485 [Anaerolineales bacterium]|nr:hypothetical protein [Anaerolineales bacterium]